MVPPKPVGFISVSIGEGIGEIFRELGVDYLIEGGQTMNPSTEDMLRAIEEVNAETIYILPNNKNIILAKKSGKTSDQRQRSDRDSDQNRSAGNHSRCHLQCRGFCGRKYGGNV